MGAIFAQEIEAPARESTIEQHTIFVVNSATDLRVLGQVREKSPVPNAGFDLGIKGLLVERFAHGAVPVDPIPRHARRK